MTLEDIKVQDIIEISKKAGEKILEIYNSNTDNWDVSVKSDNSPLTIADKESNKIICDKLVELYPDIPIISEENKEIPYSERKSFEYFWLVDPLDGTKEFIKRNGEFTVNIALVHKSTPVLGVVFVPALNILYWAKKGEGSFKIDTNGLQSKMNALKFSLNDEELIFVSSRSHSNEETEAFIGKFKNPKNTSMGSSLKLVLIAEGKAHIYPRLGPTMEWDTCAAQIVVEESGGKVVKYKDHEVFTYNKENLLNDFFVVYGNIID